MSAAPIAEHFGMVTVTMTKLIHRDERPKNFTRAIYKRELTPEQVHAVVKAIEHALLRAV